MLNTRLIAVIVHFFAKNASIAYFGVNLKMFSPIAGVFIGSIAIYFIAKGSADDLFLSA